MNLAYLLLAMSSEKTIHTIDFLTCFKQELRNVNAGTFSCLATDARSMEVKITKFPLCLDVGFEPIVVYYFASNY